MDVSDELGELIEFDESGKWGELKLEKVGRWYPEEVFHISRPPNDLLSALWADWLVQARPEVHVNNLFFVLV